MNEKKMLQTAPGQQDDINLDDIKWIIREHIVSMSRSFIVVGYYLKYVRDNKLYEQDGHETIWGFAQTEYGISKSTASRYMSMNDRFSKNGNSPDVSPEYREFGKSQLQEMLYLTDSELEQVTPDTQIKQIRDIRNQTQEAPYYELPGQMDIYDFPEAIPEQESEADLMECDSSDCGSTTIALTDFADDGLNEIAISQQENVVGYDMAAGPDCMGLAIPFHDNTMTARDAANQLISLQQYCRDMAAGSDNRWNKSIEALDMAIEALAERIDT